VADTLGGLAADDPQRARLRETLRVFLAAGGSYTTAAEQLTMHKNSVRYRVGRAEQERGRPLTEGRIDLELALMACRWLGRAVLTPAR
jgi:DNA-binding PucR family transcriptional regulator